MLHIYILHIYTEYMFACIAIYMYMLPFHAVLQRIPSGKMAIDLWLLQLMFIQGFVVICLCSKQGAYGQGNKPWETLSGKAPMVIARGGLSGLFPDQTLYAYEIAIRTSLSNAVMFCDLQLTKDAQGICRTDLHLENSTDIQFVSSNQSTYFVNGKNISGYFAIDYTSDLLLNNISAIQPYTVRPAVFDRAFHLLSPNALAGINASAIWLNVQYSKFYDEHNLSMPSYVRTLSRNMELDYISSTEAGFLRAIAPNFSGSKTKLILRFLNKEDTDPSINQTYGSILTNLTFVKKFSAGILVPKSFIWPVGTDGYLQAPTSLVKDAHTSGLEIFAADFSNDEYGMSYNYSYDPVREYLQFVDNNIFSVDGILTDFSVIASEAKACYAHNNVSRSSRAENTYSPFQGYGTLRNPAQANMGNYMNLTSFLQFVKGQANISVLINIENARAIISSSNLDVTNATLSVFNISGYDKISDRIMIQSDDSAVLLQFKQRTKFKLSYKVVETNVAISDSSIKEIKTLADTVAIRRGVIFPSSNSFLLNATDVVTRMHSQNLSVFVHFLRNEYPSLAFDYFADPTMEINSFVKVAKVDGLITDFPATASAYFKNACRQTRTENDYSMPLVVPGSLLQAVGATVRAQAPAPSLGEVIQPPLPSLKVSSAPASAPALSKSPTSVPAPSKSGCVSLTRDSLFVSLLIGLFILFAASY